MTRAKVQIPDVHVRKPEAVATPAQPGRVQKGCLARMVGVDQLDRHKPPLGRARGPQRAVLPSGALARRQADLWAEPPERKATSLFLRDVAAALHGPLSGYGDVTESGFLSWAARLLPPPVRPIAHHRASHSQANRPTLPSEKGGNAYATEGHACKAEEVVAPLL